MENNQNLYEDGRLPALSTVLNEMTVALLEQLRTGGFPAVLGELPETLYRGFRRIAVKPELLEPWRSRIDLDAMAVEIIWTLDDRAEVHHHDGAYAVLTVLGPWEGIAEPAGSTVYLDDASFPALSGITLQVVPGRLHGFSSPEGAYPVVFLSVQSRKIGEDFHVDRVGN